MKREILYTDPKVINVSKKEVAALPEILFLTTYPPRECGIATYSQDLVTALHAKFDQSFRCQICPLETDHSQNQYPSSISFSLNVDQKSSFEMVTKAINENERIKLLVIQHEFGLFQNNEEALQQLMIEVERPVIIVFHTVLPNPTEELKIRVQGLSTLASMVVVMTNNSMNLLLDEYLLQREKISLIQHGTHLVNHSGKAIYKIVYGWQGKIILTTFGLLGSGKSIETTLDALPEVVKKHPSVLFLIIGTTHPSVKKQEGERYRNYLEEKIEILGLNGHVEFVNRFVPLPKLLEYLQLTDIYLFTSKDRNQAVSGTFSYAISSGCPIISTPIPHAQEVIGDGAGLLVDFENSDQLKDAIISLLENEPLRRELISNAIHKISSTAWENSALAHVKLFSDCCAEFSNLRYNLPPIHITHLEKMTNTVGLIQFSKLHEPDLSSGYTLDDNARACIALCTYYEMHPSDKLLTYIWIYFNFMKKCVQKEGYFFNYLDQEQNFTAQNFTCNLADSNGRAVWALGYLISIADLFPIQDQKMIKQAEELLSRVLENIENVHSTRAMAFIMKGLYYQNLRMKMPGRISLLRTFADRIVQLYEHEAEENWHWFEGYLTYANSVIPEALLLAWSITGESRYKTIAKKSFDFLLTKITKGKHLCVISNNGWLHREHAQGYCDPGGEQAIDVTYTILALDTFNSVFEEEKYSEKLDIAFSWFLGNNHLNQIVYNPCTGGCYDGLEASNVNLNQGAESTVCYLLARLTMEKNKNRASKLSILESNLQFLEKVS